MTQAQRDRWTAIAAVTEMPDRWGLLKPMNGKDLFIKCNFNFYQCFVELWIKDCPNDPLRHVCEPSLTWLPGPGRVQIDLPIGLYSPAEEGLFAFAYGGKPVSQTTNYFKGPWRFYDHNSFEGGAWIHEPWFWDYPWTISSGDRLWVEVCVWHFVEGWTTPRGRAMLDVPASEGAEHRTWPVKGNWQQRELVK